MGREEVVDSGGRAADVGADDSPRGGGGGREGGVLGSREEGGVPAGGCEWREGGMVQGVADDGRLEVRAAEETELMLVAGDGVQAE